MVRMMILVARSLFVLFVLIALLPTTANAAPALPLPLHTLQDEHGDTQSWEHPDFGLTFEYPADWFSSNEQGFDFLLIQPPAEGKQANFVGMQSAPLQGGETMQSFFDGFAQQYGQEVAPSTFGGLDALTMPLPDNDGRRGFLLGFMPSPYQFALLIFSANVDEWTAFSDAYQTILDTASIKSVVLDVAALDAELLASMETDQVLRLGAADAPIKVVEVLDFSCPHCVNYSPSVQRLIQDYVNTEKVQLEFHFVTFVGAELSQNATHAQYCAAGLGFGWQAHETIMEIFFNEGAAGYTPENLNSHIGALEDVDAAAFATCLDEQTHADLLARDDAFAQESQVTGTPSLLFGSDGATPDFIRQNGEVIRGAIALRPLYAYLDELLAE